MQQIPEIRFFLVGYYCLGAVFFVPSTGGANRLTDVRRSSHGREPVVSQP
jgi:hypothetical protein